MQSAKEGRSLKERQRNERELLILHVAEEVLAEKGYHDTSMEEIASRVGIAKGTVYLHFPSKEDLVVAIFAQRMNTFLRGLDDALAGSESAREKLEALLLFFYLGSFRQPAHLLANLYNTADLRTLFIEKKPGCIREIWQTLEERITNLFEEGKAAQEFDLTIPTSVMVTAFVSLLAPRTYERLITSTQHPIEELTHHLVRLFFDGVALKQS